MSNSGFTISPDITFDPETGEEILDYANASIDSHDDRLEQIAQFEHEQEQYYYEDPETGVRNYLADGAYDEEPIEQEEFEPIEFTEQDQMSLQNTIGGAAEYAAMTAWAAENLPSDIIDQYNHLCEAGDYEELEMVITNLYDAYLQNGGLDFVPQERVSNAPQDFVDNLLDSIGSDTYSAAIEWAANGGLSEQDINAYDSVMERGSQKELMDSAFNLVRYYQTHN